MESTPSTIYNTSKHIKSFVYLEHPISKRIKKCPLGFSWTACFFSCFVPVYRGLPTLALIMLGIDILNCILTPLIPAWGFIAIGTLVAYGMLLNKYCIEFFLKEGYIPTNDESVELIRYL